jgi:formimidoylglutamate deiminase
MSERLLAASHRAGIGITLMPVLYSVSGFGGTPPQTAQRRFAGDVDGLLRMIQRLTGTWRGDPEVRIGVAPHSLRAVMPDALDACIRGMTDIDSHAPIHIHVAEQVREVDDCVRFRGARPLEWLLGNAPIDRRFCLVHATHATAAEIDGMQKSGAVVGLCPTTEANLGDGFFPAIAYLAAGGAMGVGSDSHISVSPVEELRWLEYGQRLLERRRNRLAGRSGSVGADLYRAALAGGAAALGRPVGRLAPGARADLLVLDPDHPALCGKRGDRLIDALVFAGNSNPVRDVMVGGRWIVEGGRHHAEEAVLVRFRAVMEGLAA